MDSGVAGREVKPPPTCCCSTRPARSRSATASPRNSSRCPASPKPNSPKPRKWPHSLRRNLWIYGLGGIIAPFIGIKLIDLIIHNLLGA